MSAAVAKVKPDSELLSQAAIARRLKLSVPTVASRLEDLGYSPEQVNPNGPNAKLFRFDDEMEFALKAAKDSVQAGKIRVMRADAELKELKLAEMRGELVPITEATDFAQRLVRAIYDEISVRQPKRIAGQLVKAKTQAAVRKILKTDTDRVMKLLRTNFERYLDG